MVQKIYKFQVFMDGTEAIFCSNKTCKKVYNVEFNFKSIGDILEIAGKKFEL
jgi:hypothetical protein